MRGPEPSKKQPPSQRPSPSPDPLVRAAGLPDWAHSPRAVPPDWHLHDKETRNTPGPRVMFDVGSRSCGCIGVDYAGQTCAAAFLCGTMVEVRVTEGAFDDAELVELVCSLRPVASAARAEQLFRQPFAERCYWARHPHAGARHVPWRELPVRRLPLELWPGPKGARAVALRLLQRPPPRRVRVARRPRRLRPGQRRRH
ncbi:unnamed protein product [Prorocentrum cordatum]|uniref:Uncharacterized protein n=1 Tax=Prorocentrum cordatum TaxID=2364126 RepID=A0ABN9PI75_9DINO|nr:unnamed protein product [Polarella glacialis]